ncbi:alpha/beta hydrolase [Brenneria goodwinii]|uniref:alpha/beta fold hydrolase n=1 Tax=Brenneria goodwinii TaxID=1109412 RepID=UPI0036E75A7A
MSEKNQTNTNVHQVSRRNLLLGSAAAASLMAFPALSRGKEMVMNSLSMDSLTLPSGFSFGKVETPRHRTIYLQVGPKKGPLMIFIHGHPELAIIWRAQMEYFAARGWHCVAPDMRGYGNSSIPQETRAYSVRELVADMVELHDDLGGEPAVWIGHDWGSPVAWAMGSHHPERSRALVNLSVPYFSRGFALPNLVAQVDRNLYPIDKFPVGQWDYWLFYRESFEKAARDFERNVESTIDALFRPGTPDAEKKIAFTADLRAQGGWFGRTGIAPSFPAGTGLLSKDDLTYYTRVFKTNGFKSADAWYLNDIDNITYAGEAKHFGLLSLPVLFIHGKWDSVCETVRSRLAKPMRDDCANLSEVFTDAGHFPMLEKKNIVNAAIEKWIFEKVNPGM